MSQGGALAQGLPGQGGACDRQLLEKIEGRYIGHNLGFESRLEVTDHEPENCRIEARWETLNERAPVSDGNLALTLEDGVLRGDWTSGDQSGRARFDVLRDGGLLNGSIMGLAGEPNGPWDYTKAQ